MFGFELVVGHVHQVPELLLMLFDDELRQRRHLDDVRCPVCQAAPEMMHAAGYACAGTGRWFGTLAERRDLRSAAAAEAMRVTSVSRAAVSGRGRSAP